MFSKILSVFKSKRGAAGFAFAVVAFGSAFFLDHVGSSRQLTTTLQSGLQTCFQRIHQSYTAKVIGGSGAYLDSQFTGLTEECLGEAKTIFENRFAGVLVGTERLMNNLTTDVHWFHETISKNDGTPAEVIISNAGGRFEKIEKLKDEVMDNLYRASEGFEATAWWMMVVFSLSSFASILFMGLEAVRVFKEASLHDAIEEEAMDTLSEGLAMNMDHAGTILKRALDQKDLKVCSELFDFYKERQLHMKAQGVRTANVDVAGSSTFMTKGVSARDIESIWNEAETQEKINKPLESSWIPSSVLAPEEDKIIHLDAVLATIVNRSSEKLFSKGLNVQLDVKEDVYIEGEIELIEQVIFHSINFALANVSGDQSGRTKLTLSLRALGPMAAFEVLFTGDGIKKEALDALSGLSRAGVGADISLSIISELMKEAGGRFVAENAVEGGAKLKLIFTSILSTMNASSDEAPTKRVDRVIKGSKKDILKELRQA